MKGAILEHGVGGEYKLVLEGLMGICETVTLLNLLFRASQQDLLIFFVFL